jgi:hypothetical protein
MAILMERMIRAAKLDMHLYEEVETDKSATGQAVTVVVLSSLAAGIGTIHRKCGMGRNSSGNDFRPCGMVRVGLSDVSRWIQIST